jgi:hypothetical protein
MTKYKKLGQFLREHVSEEIPMTFAEIERVIGCALPRTSRYPAWWSNHPSNNTMTKIWLEAGFKTEQVNTEGRKLVFRRTSPPLPHPDRKNSSKDIPGMAEVSRSFSAASEEKTRAKSREADNPSAPKDGYYPFYGSMKGLITIAPGVDLTEPADPEWGKLVEKKYGRKK